MIIEAWFRKAKRHMDVCVYFEMDNYPHIINSCFLAMYSVIKALLALKNKECRTLEGVIYLLKISYVDEGLFDREMFRFFCKTKEMNTEFFRCNSDYFDEKMAIDVFNRTNEFVEYSRELCFNIYKNKKNEDYLVK